jgi:hypothetical protein
VHSFCNAEASYAATHGRHQTGRNIPLHVMVATASNVRKAWLTRSTEFENLRARSRHNITTLSGKRICLVLRQRSKGVVHVAVACLICPYCQDQVPHGGLRGQAPVGLGDGRGMTVRPEPTCINVLYDTAAAAAWPWLAPSGSAQPWQGLQPNSVARPPTPSGR